MRLWVLAVVLGIAAGYASLAFREGVLLIQWATFGSGKDELYRIASALPAWQIVLVPTLGGLAVGLMAKYLMPYGRPEGVSDVMAVAARSDGNISARSGIGAALISATSVGVGASVGREGPVVHMGAAIGALLSRWFGIGYANRITLLGCGVAAAISASFNAPIAGAFFALEVVIGHYGMRTFAPIVIASVAGTVISRAHFGAYPAFIVPDHRIASILEFPAFALLGVAAALLTIVLLRAVIVTDRVSRMVPVPDWLRPMGAGLLVGLIALAFPHVLGVGYGATDAALKGAFPLSLLIALIIAKTAATAISLGGGFGGGIFSPSLFIGAMLGAAFGTVATSIQPDLSSGLGAYALVGMGATAAAALGAPISTILIVFELTGSYQIAIAVMVAVVIATGITRALHGQSFFTWQLAMRGVDLERDEAASVLDGVRVADVMQGDVASSPHNQAAREVLTALRDAPCGVLYVTDSTGGLTGSIMLSDIPEQVFREAGGPATAGALARSAPAILAPGDALDTAIARMEESGAEHLPVVLDRESMRPIGTLRRIDALARLNAALQRARGDERMGI